VVCESNFPKRIAYDFLYDVTERYFATSSSFNMKERLTHFNTLPSQDKILGLQRGVEEVNAIVLEDIKLVIQRGTKLEVLLDKAEGMQANAKLFQKEAVKVERYFCCQAFIWRIGIIAVVVVLAVLIVLFVGCGTLDLGSCF
jgi:hypothetical protein